MSDIEVTKAFIFSPIPTAQMIEDKVGQYLNIVQPKPKEFAVAENKYTDAVIKPTNIKEESIYPAIGMEIVKAFVDRLLLINSGWLNVGGYLIREELNKHLLQEYQNNDEVLSLLESILFEVRIDVNQFIGKDKFIMHFMRTRRYDIVIEKTIDYRIYWYNQNVINEI